MNQEWFFSGRLSKPLKVKNDTNYLQQQTQKPVKEKSKRKRDRSKFFTFLLGHLE
jgi:hypothetical protein